MSCYHQLSAEAASTRSPASTLCLHYDWASVRLIVFTFNAEVIQCGITTASHWNLIYAFQDRFCNPLTSKAHLEAQQLMAKLQSAAALESRRTLKSESVATRLSKTRPALATTKEHAHGVSRACAYTSAPLASKIILLPLVQRRLRGLRRKPTLRRLPNNNHRTNSGRARSRCLLCSNQVVRSHVRICRLSSRWAG